MSEQAGAAGRDGGLRGRVVMITGASRGLGGALARRFAAAGAHVSICARSADELERVAEQVRSQGVRCVLRAVDVNDESAVAGWARETREALGAPDVLINNASVLGPRVPLAEYPLEQWRTTLEVNLTGTFVVTRAVLPDMIRSGRGCIINVSSGAAVLPRVEWGAYSISKHALEGLSLNLAREVEGSGVRVNIVDPGAMRTAMRADAYPAEDPRSIKSPEDATGVFLWLASDAAAGVSGQRFRADEFRAS